ncbi:MAG TPA: tyrosine-protein phosphatase, partial [Solirubrobacteraceae bacterium]|nr:tyrosine-protein phosphatase [Solirubrobacteraceae bacterium]
VLGRRCGILAGARALPLHGRQDRTGVVAGLVLRLAGVGIEAIAADYALTDLSALLRRGLAGGMPQDEIRARTFLPCAQPDGIAQFQRYGSAAGYLERAGVDPAPARELTRRLAAGSA